MSIEGTWQLTQSIDGQPPFPVVFASGGRASVDVGGVSFVGAWAASSGEVTFTLANARSATVYQGTLNEDEIITPGVRRKMSGNTLSVAAGASTATPGTWSATLPS